MLYLLDTCICVAYLRKGEAAKRVEGKILQHAFTEIKIPSIVVAELLHGVYKSRKRDENLRDVEQFISYFDVISFDTADAYTYGQIRSSLERKGLIIGDNDMLIAASALLRNATLVTNNTREFSRIDGLLLDDWTL